MCGPKGSGAGRNGKLGLTNVPTPAVSGAHLEPARTAGGGAGARPRAVDRAAPSAAGGVDLAGPNPYLDLPGLARALRACRAEAVWPGWGFVSENPEFARLCGELGIVFVGPAPEVMRA